MFLCNLLLKFRCRLLLLGSPVNLLSKPLQRFYLS